MNCADSTRAGLIQRAQGCLMGQLCGDALGSLVEFMPPEEIHRTYPGGVRDLADGGTWNTLAGQPTDDSEMALALARTLVAQGRFDAEAIRVAYVDWFASGPFDCGGTVRSGLQGTPNPESQANGALMRVSPLGVFGARHPLESVADWARRDAALTHPNPVCVEANALFAMTVAEAVRSGPAPAALYARVVQWAGAMDLAPHLASAVYGAADGPPARYTEKMGWVVIALQNAFWQLLHAPSLEAALVDTVMRGGDTDTNAAICGALMGAVRGLGAVPARWAENVLICRPEAGRPGVYQPRPGRYWPVDALALAARLVAAPENGGIA